MTRSGVELVAGSGACSALHPDKQANRNCGSECSHCDLHSGPVGIADRRNWASVAIANRSDVPHAQLTDLILGPPGKSDCLPDVSRKRPSPADCGVECLDHQCADFSRQVATIPCSLSRDRVRRQNFQANVAPTLLASTPPVIELVYRMLCTRCRTNAIQADVPTASLKEISGTYPSTVKFCRRVPHRAGIHPRNDAGAGTRR